ncbi:MAG: phosphogluconate dehydrogenase (NAD(+)-dependent, decarboxylating) [Candidatus Levyibacteriota bacterium]
MKIGFIGLGKMGKAMVLHLLEEGMEIVAWNRSKESIEELRIRNQELWKNKKIHNSKFIIHNSNGGNLTTTKTLEELVKTLKTPRIIWLMVSAGEAVDAVLNELMDKLSSGDLIIDGGNSLYTHTLRRAKTLAKKQIHYMDCGISGGIEGARNGACIMVGGQKEDFKRIEPILKSAARKDGYAHLGPIGAGHFAKTIHNGIEYGMMEAIGEGAAILKYAPFKYDLSEVFRIYNNGSIIESRLVGWTLNELKKDQNLSDISSVIGSGGGSGKTKGEGHWTVEMAKKMGVETPVLNASVCVRDNSDKDKEISPNGFRNKVVAAMRWQFGRHPVKKK